MKPRIKGVLLCLLVVLVVGAGVIAVAIKPQAPQVPAGRVKWTHFIGDFGGILGNSSPMVSDGIVYIGNRENMIYALSAASGQVIWSTQLGNYTDPSAILVPSPVVSNGVVYANSQLGALYALDARTGRTLWFYQMAYAAMTAPAVANGVVYIGSEDGRLYALDALSGRKLWSSGSGYFDFLDASPAVANGLIYVFGPGGGVYALDAVSGRKVWLGAGNAGYTPTIVNGLVYVTTLDGELYALDAASGKEQWYFFSSHCCGFSGSPIVIGKTIYIYSLAGMFAVDAITHHERWLHKMSAGGTWTTPVVVKDTISVIAADRNFRPPQNSLDIFPDKDELDVLDVSSGKEVWFCPLGGLVFSTPAVSNGVTYVGAKDGKLYALLPPV
jgi:outer membrane protein assembly factor BamB